MSMKGEFKQYFAYFCVAFTLTQGLRCVLSKNDDNDIIIKSNI